MIEARKKVDALPLEQRGILQSRTSVGPERDRQYPVSALSGEGVEPLLIAGCTKGKSLDVAALNLTVVTCPDGEWQAADVIVHDPKNKAVAHMLIDMPIGSFPMALGVIYDDPRPTFESAVREQQDAIAAGKPADLQALVAKGQTWQVTSEG